LTSVKDPGDYAYTLLDVDTAEVERIAAELQEQEDILRVRPLF